MSDNTNTQNQPRRQRITMKYLKSRAAASEAINRMYRPSLQSIDDAKKNANKRTKNVRKGPAKKQRSEATAPAPAPVQNVEASSSVENSNDNEEEEEKKRSKHYDEQKKLQHDWDLLKDNLIKRYYMSFGKEQIAEAFVDPRKIEVERLPSCSKCAVLKANVKVYFLNRHCHLEVEFCKCCSLAETLVQMQLMPKTIKAPETAVHFGLLDFFQQLESTSQISSGAMAGVLNWMNAKDGSPIMSEDTLSSIRVNYQRFIFFAKQSLLQNYKVQKAVDICLPCEVSDVYEYMMDANFSLKRIYRKQELEPYSVEEERRVWVQQEEVDAAAAEDNAAKEAGKKGKGRAGDQDQAVCNTMKDSNIKAAQGHQRTGRQGYAANGVFAMVCRHGMISKFVDVSAGETHSLALACVKKVIEQNAGLQKPYFITYDIMCRIRNSIKRLIPNEVASKSQFALPVLHCYGHKMHCQMEYSPRYLAGFGLTDGEGIERFWSYLGEFTKLTRGMTKSNRQMTLLTAAKNYGAQKMENIGEQLDDQYCRALGIIAAAEKELLGEDESRLMDTWQTIRLGLLGSSGKVDRYLANCMKHLELLNELRGYSAEGDEDNSRLHDIEGRLDHYLKKMIEEERRMRRSGLVVVRPCSLEDTRFSGLRTELVKEEKAECLLTICISVYIMKTLRPLIKGRRGKAGVNMAKRLDEQVRSERKKAEAAIELYNKIVNRQEQDGLLLPKISAIDRGEITPEQSSLLFSAADAKTLHLFMKLRAQEEVIYIKNLAHKLKSLKETRLGKFEELLINLEAKIDMESSETEKTYLTGVRCVVKSMYTKEIEWWTKTTNYLAQIPSATLPSSSVP